jgi:cation:H+ antiporter
LYVLGYTFTVLGRAKHYQKTEAEEHIDVPENLRQVIRDSLIACGAMVLTVGGAQLVLSITEMIVQVTGVGGSLIGVVTLGVASALPELTTALSGIKNRAHGVSIGTLVGSNITNPW